MAVTTKDAQHITEAYRRAGKEWPATARDIASWAIEQNLWKPSRDDQVRQCTDQLTRAMREEYFTDPQGRKVRVMHVAREVRNGELVGLWDDIRTADRPHMAAAFQLRRQQIVGDCRQLKTDVNSYNENGNTGDPIDLVLDFTWDVEELEAAELGEPAEAFVS